MQQNQCLSMGRTELAQLYFPYILPKSAWGKLKALLLERKKIFLVAAVLILFMIHARLI